MHVAGPRQLLFFTTCSDDSKPYMILVALTKAFQNNVGFAIYRPSGAWCRGMAGARPPRNRLYTAVGTGVALYSGPDERVKNGAKS